MPTITISPGSAGWPVKGQPIPEGYVADPNLVDAYNRALVGPAWALKPGVVIPPGEYPTAPDVVYIGYEPPPRRDEPVYVAPLPDEPVYVPPLPDEPVYVPPLPDEPVYVPPVTFEPNLGTALMLVMGALFLGAKTKPSKSKRR